MNLERYLTEIKNDLVIFFKIQDYPFERTYAGRDTLIAASAYLPFVSAAILLLRRAKNNEFVSFHARQSLVLLVISLLGLLLLPTLIKILLAIIAIFLLSLGAYTALKGRKWYVPIVTELANAFEV